MNNGQIDLCVCIKYAGKIFDAMELIKGILPILSFKKNMKIATDWIITIGLL